MTTNSTFDPTYPSGMYSNAAEAASSLLELSTYIQSLINWTLGEYETTTGINYDQTPYANTPTSKEMQDVDLAVQTATVVSELLRILQEARNIHDESAINEAVDKARVLHESHEEELFAFAEAYMSFRNRHGGGSKKKLRRHYSA